MKIKVERKPGLWGWNWLWGTASVSVVRKGKRTLYKFPLNREVYMPKHVQQVAFAGPLSALSLRVLVYRGRSPHA
jgi:hypothetical protein